MGDNRSTWNRLLGPLWRRIRLMISRGVVKLVDDSLKLQGVQTAILGAEPAWAERFQEYGYTSHPLEGAEAILAAVGGARSHLAAIAVDDRRYRIKDLEPGEVCLYTDEGDEIRFKRGQVISVVAGSKLDVSAPEVNVVASTSVKFDTPKVTCTKELIVQGLITGQGGMSVSGGDGAAVQVDGEAEFSGDVTADGVSVAHHKHDGDSGGTTSEPI
ncbi:MAG: phage baseplate assembly protein V [Thermodesulfobacteriota bacterium]